MAAQINIAAGFHIQPAQREDAACRAARRGAHANAARAHHLLREGQPTGRVIHIEIVLRAGHIADRDGAELHDLVAGIGDHRRAAHCGGGIADIERGDIERRARALRDVAGDHPHGGRAVAQHQPAVGCAHAGQRQIAGAANHHRRRRRGGRGQRAAQHDIARNGAVVAGERDAAAIGAGAGSGGGGVVASGIDGAARLRDATAGERDVGPAGGVFARRQRKAGQIERTACGGDGDVAMRILDRTGQRETAGCIIETEGRRAGLLQIKRPQLRHLVGLVERHRTAGRGVAVHRRATRRIDARQRASGGQDAGGLVDGAARTQLDAGGPRGDIATERDVVVGGGRLQRHPACRGIETAGEVEMVIAGSDADAAGGGGDRAFEHQGAVLVIEGKAAAGGHGAHAVDLVGAAQGHRAIH